MLQYHSLWQAIRHTFSDIKVRLLLTLAFMLIAIATVFYHFQEDWGWIDALYFSVITISTVGYGDFSPQTPLGKLFTVGYLIVGIGLFVVATATFAEHLLGNIRTQAPADKLDKWWEEEAKYLSVHEYKNTLMDKDDDKD